MTADRIPLEAVIVERSGAGPGCACTGAANPELPRFAGDVERLHRQVTDVRRMDPRETGMAFPDLPAARAALDEGSGSCPLRETLQALIARERVSPVPDELPR